MPAPPQPAVRVQPTVVVAGGGGAASTAVSVQGPNHLLHLILTVCTCGFWLPALDHHCNLRAANGYRSGDIGGCSHGVGTSAGRAAPDVGSTGQPCLE